MGSILDSIVKKSLISGPESVSSQYISEMVTIGGIEEAFIVSLSYDGGDGSVDMDLYLDISIDGENFSPILAAQNITEDSGSHIWDIVGTGAVYCRIRIEVNAGSMDLQSARLSGKRRH